MKKFISVLLILSLLLSLGACRKRKVEEQATEPTDSPTESTRATTQSAPTEPPTEEPTQEPEKPKEVLEVLQYGSLSGAFVEDGSDRAVEN
ncbi:MAG: hypothetical protein IKT58_01925, partial [Oscillospiraceae bacterium]|nr:hypothetical protein [Oscillospiraceae bacterium]